VNKTFELISPNAQLSFLNQNIDNSNEELGGDYSVVLASKSTLDPNI
jgi:hypothetical protein